MESERPQPIDQSETALRVQERTGGRSVQTDEGGPKGQEGKGKAGEGAAGVSKDGKRLFMSHLISDRER